MIGVDPAEGNATVATAPFFMVWGEHPFRIQTIRRCLATLYAGYVCNLPSLTHVTFTIREEAEEQCAELNALAHKANEALKVAGIEL